MTAITEHREIMVPFHSLFYRQILLQGVDEDYDLGLVEYFNNYHQFVDKICRYALNSDQIPFVVIEISEYYYRIFLTLPKF